MSAVGWKRTGLLEKMSVENSNGSPENRFNLGKTEVYRTRLNEGRLSERWTEIYGNQMCVYLWTYKRHIDHSIYHVNLADHCRTDQLILVCHYLPGPSLGV